MDAVQHGILQVHPTRLCNLSCSHCYTDSSPAHHGSLDPALLCRAIADAGALGFDVLSLSGGEPLLYRGLDDVLQVARSANQRVNLVSNGILVANQRYERIAGSFDTVALSLDGLADRHNAIRNSPRSYEQVRQAAAILRQDGQCFGLIHTLTAESLDEVEELVSIALEWGASFLQFHPFESSGRGTTANGMSELSAHERLIAWLTIRALEARCPEIRLQLDLIHRDVVEAAPEVVGASSSVSRPQELVIDECGTVVPVCHGMPRSWRVTDLVTESLLDAWPNFVDNEWPARRVELEQVARDVVDGAHGEVVAWHAVVRAAVGNQRHPRWLLKREDALGRTGTQEPARAV